MSYLTGLTYTYSAEPASAVAVDYGTVQLTWTAPTGGLGLYLVRNPSSVPTDQNNGTLVASWGSPYPGLSAALAPSGASTWANYVADTWAGLGASTWADLAGVSAAAGSSGYVDTGLDVAGFGGSFLYYSLFMMDSAGWWRSADMVALLPARYGYGATLFSLLPQYFQDADNAQVSGYQS